VVTEMSEDDVEVKVVNEITTVLETVRDIWDELSTPPKLQSPIPCTSCPVAVILTKDVYLNVCVFMCTSIN